MYVGRRNVSDDRDQVIVSMSHENEPCRANVVRWPGLLFVKTIRVSPFD